MKPIRLYLLLFFILSYAFNKVEAQGRNHNWLIGYDVGLFDTNVTSTKARLLVDSANVFVQPETRKMAFNASQGNISDENGNLLISSNGCWLANSTGDTLLNGAGLNPGLFTATWCSSTDGIPFPHCNIFLPYPNDTTKYILFHETGEQSSLNAEAQELYYTIIDMSLDSGKGGVPNGQKNLVAIQDTLKQGMAACKHGNGRDWWIATFKYNSDEIYLTLLTPLGVVSSTPVSTGLSPHINYQLGQSQFSPDGKKFAYYFRDFGTSGIPAYNQIRLFDFDRCTGALTNPQTINVTDSLAGLALAFSPNSKYLYFALFDEIFQINTDTSNAAASLQSVAVYDGYCYPYNFTCTSFFLMYLAANGKIYISSGGSIIDFSYINSPDSNGSSCDVQQHALHLSCYAFQSNVYHPNYYHGCDTTSSCPCLTTGLTPSPSPMGEGSLRISPNPTSGNIKIVYLLPQNKSGVFEVFDINGKKVFSYTLPPWSTLQNFSLPRLADGMYQCIIKSGGFIVSKKLVVAKD